MNLAIKGFVENVYVSKISYDLMFHQILTMSLAEFGINKERVFDVLKETYSFSGINREEYEDLLGYMIDKKFIQIERNNIYVDT